MHDVAVRVGHVGWREWLLGMADTRTLRRIEVPADLVWAGGPDLLKLAQHLGLSLLHVADVVPASLSCHLSDGPWADDESVLALLAAQVRKHLPEGVRFGSLDLGLDRLAMGDFAEGLRRRSSFVRRLARELAPLGTRVAVRVRMPRPFAGSHQWEWAGNLLDELRPEGCCLAVDVVLHDLPEGFDPEALLRDCAAHVGLVRLHFRPQAGEAPDAGCREAWASVLRRQPGTLVIVFCPSGPTLAPAAGLLADIERWAGRL